MAEFLYRYRPAAAVLDGFHELEHQEVYFSPLADLNDPMEGHRDFVWRGDAIAFRNLLKHYVRCLAIAYSLLPLWSDDFSAEECFKLVYAVEPEPPEAPVKALISSAAERLLALPITDRLARDLAGRESGIRRYELTFFLRILHMVALGCVLDATKARGLPLPIADLPAGTVDTAIANLGLMLDLPSVPSEHAEALFGAAESTASELRLLNTLAPGVAEGLPAQVPFIVADFATHYVPSLSRLLYPDWHVASFVEDPRNAAMWSAYADSHKGVCLKFKTGGTAERPTLAIFRTVGWGGGQDTVREHKDWRPMAFSRVAYRADFPEVDFFNSFGVIPHGHLDAFWYSDGAGGRSRIADRLQQDEDAWREAYWAVFETCCNFKTPHWAHEQEHRLVLHSMMQTFDTVESRKLRYRFSDLAGVIFGVRTSDADKIRIAKIIEAKCDAAGRSDFQFYQAAFEANGEMKLSPLGMLKIGQPAE